MEPDRETLGRFVDGELTPEEMERVGEMLARRPDLDAYVRRQEKLRSELRAAFGELDGAIPARLIEAVRSTPISWRWRLRTMLTPILSVRWLVPAGAALAFGLVIGLVARPQSDLGADASGQLVAQGGLGHILDTRLASDGAGLGSAQVGISFLSKTGEDCRTFTDGKSAGLACRQGGAWVIETLARKVREDEGAAYRMAGSDMPDAVRRAVMARIAGKPFDAATEAHALAGGWSGQ